MGTKTQIAVTALALLLPAVVGRGLRAGDLPAAPPRDRAAPGRRPPSGLAGAARARARRPAIPPSSEHPPRRAGPSDSRTPWP